MVLWKSTFKNGVIIEHSYNHDKEIKRYQY